MGDQIRRTTPMTQGSEWAPRGEGFDREEEVPCFLEHPIRVRADTAGR